MRQIAAILLLTILVFNWFGYRIVANYFQGKADQQLEARLDIEDYDVSQLIELKVPLNMPYQLNHTDFERVDGEIEIEGIHYKYVKRRVFNDSLVLLCLPNEQKMKIEGAKKSFFSLVNDLQPSSKKESGNNNTPTIKNILSEYFLVKNDWITPLFLSLSTIYFSKNSTAPRVRYKAVAEQPPNC